MRREVLALKDFLSREKGLYEKMLKLSMAQKERPNDIEFLFSALREKQELVLEIEKLNSQMGALKDWWRENKSVLDEEEKGIIESLFSEIEDLLCKLLELEGLLAKKVRESQAEIEKELGKITAGKKAVKAYYGGTGARQEARFVDRQQ